MYRATETTVILFGLLVIPIGAQETRIVSPNAFSDVEAPDGIVPPGTGRIQILYEASDFSTLTRPHWITQFAWRPDASINRPTSARSQSIEHRLSTTRVGIDDMSLVFDDNVGPDAMVVYSGHGQVLRTENIGPSSGPKEFDLVTVFDTPFFYDPSQGNLLLDFDLSAATSLPADWIVDPRNSPTMKHIAGPLGVARARLTFGGIVTQFTFRAVGDIDENGSLGPADIDALSENIRLGGPAGFPFDLDNNGELNDVDRQVWVHDLVGTWFGDANLDGEFSTDDLVMVFQAGQYEDEIQMNSGWSDGDFDGDGDFGTGDLVLAFQDRGFEQGMRPVTASVPEPASAVLLMIGLAATVIRRRHVNE